MEKEYIVFGDYGYTTEKEMYATNSLNTAIQWAKQFAKKEQANKFSKIEVAWFADDGEFVTEWSHQVEECA